MLIQILFMDFGQTVLEELRSQRKELFYFVSQWLSIGQTTRSLSFPFPLPYPDVGFPIPLS